MAKELIPAGIISDKSIFGAYSHKENRVTAALLHLIDIGGEPLLRALFEDLPDSSISVRTQVSRETDNAQNSIYDGIVSCGFSFCYIIESKVVPNAVVKAQLEKYIQQAQTDKMTLIYITPDDQRPSLLNSVYWYNWTTIADRLKSYEDEDTLLQYLIEQFVLLLSNLGLYEDWKERVLIVGGSLGEPIAEKYHFYACQNNRRFKRCEYIAFAYNHQIRTLFRIKGRPTNNCDLRNIPEIANSGYLSSVAPPYNGNLQEVFLLENKNLLKNPIQNDKKSQNGKRVAFVQGQTYTTYEKITKAKFTSEL